MCKDNRHKTLILYSLVVWIYSFGISSASEILSKENVSVLKNFTYRSKNDDVVLNVVHKSRTKIPDEPQQSSNQTSVPDVQVSSYGNVSATKSEDSTTRSTSYSSVLQYNVTVFTPSEPTHLRINEVSNLNSTSKNPKSDDLAAVLNYLRFLESFSDPTKLSQVIQHRNRLKGSCKRPQKRLAFLDKMLEDYDKRAWPTYGTDVPTRVKVNIYINTLGPVNAAQMEYGMDIYLRQIWNDPRLQLSRSGVTHEMTLNAEDIADHIWKPDIFFRNVKQANFHKVTVPNKLIKISPEGNVLYSMRITMRLACHMSFRHYPLDSQRCQIVLGSYAQTTDQVIIEWREKDPIFIEQALELPEFDVSGMSYSNFTRNIDTGAFSFLNVTFVLVRQNGFHLIQTYMPTFLIVMISWVSFWLNVDATPARVTLGVTTLLTLTTVAYGVRLQLPPVSYIKAIDVWIGACSVMVFGALLEFTLVNYLSRSKFRPEQFKHSINIFHWSKKLQMAQDIEGAVRTEEEIAKNLKRARYVDRFCRIMFPFAFVVFNIAYWLYYLYVPDTAI